MRSQLRLRFEQEAKLLKKSVTQVARREKRIQDRELEIKNLEVLLETEAEMKRAVEGKNAELMRELEDICAQFSGLKVSNEHLSQRVAALQEQVSGEEKLKASFEEFKRQAFADVVSAGVAKGMSEGLKHGVVHGRSQLELESIEAYDPEAEAKFVAALQSLKDLKFSLLDQLEGLKDAPMDVI
nr:transposase (putative), gypsy type [Tanacetum cinerariifolium]